MGSLYAAEKLSAKVLRLVLKSLADGAAFGFKAVHNYVVNHLDASEIQHLNQKGGGAKIKRVLYYSNRINYTTKHGRGDVSSYEITSKGARHLQKLSFKNIHFDSKNWDGKWRILSFDIPESNRAARDAVRRLIRELGFKQLHRSVWVLPYDCEDSIETLKTAYGIEDDLSLLTVVDFDQEQRFKVQFGL